MRIPVPFLVLVLVLAALPALAHGPTVSIGKDGPDPATLEIVRGETVHFTNGTDANLRVRGDDDSFHSPELAPGGGWHLPFPFPGRFGYALDGDPGVRGEIVVKRE